MVSKINANPQENMPVGHLYYKKDKLKMRFKNSLLT